MTGQQAVANLAMVGQRVVDWLSGLPFSRIHNSLCSLFILWIVYALAQLVPLLGPHNSSDVSVADSEAAVAPDSATGAKEIDIAQLQQLHLMGEAGAQAEVVAPAPLVEDEVIEAEKTKLNLTLEGIAHAPVASESLAVIVYQGKQEQYYIGDKLPVGGRVTLAKVFIDHVILDNSGKYESLWLYDEEKKLAQRVKKQRQAPSAAVKDMRGSVAATTLAKDYRERLYKNPSSLAEVLRISPAQVDGILVGYRVSPGKDRDQFKQLGFKSNDIVTSINGIELNEPSKALEIYKLMRTAREASFTVDRGGESLELMVSLGESE